MTSFCHVMPLTSTLILDGATGIGVALMSSQCTGVSTINGTNALPYIMVIKMRCNMTFYSCDTTKVSPGIMSC